MTTPAKPRAKATRAPRIPLAEQPIAKQVDWMRRQLASIDGASMVNSLSPQTPRIDDAAACRKELLRVVASLKKEFPATVWITPSGLQWKGSAIPEHMTRIEFPKKDRFTVFGSLLHMGAMLCPENSKLIRWMLASGCDGSLYHHDAGSTAIGYMAYACKPKCVRVCREAGLDMTLLLRADQMGSGKPQDPDIVNSTLLHRFVKRFDHFPRPKDAAEVLKELLLSGLDPMAASASGRTARDMAQGVASEIVEEWVAGLQAKDLQGKTTAAPTKSRTLRL